MNGTHRCTAARDTWRYACSTWKPALKHYIDVLGLDRDWRATTKGRVFLKAWDEHDHHSVVLREADEAGMDYMGWRSTRRRR